MVQKRIILHTIPRKVNLSNNSTKTTQIIAFTFFRGFRGLCGITFPPGWQVVETFCSRWPSWRPAMFNATMVLQDLFLWKCCSEAGIFPLSVLENRRSNFILPCEVLRIAAHGCDHLHVQGFTLGFRYEFRVMFLFTSVWTSPHWVQLVKKADMTPMWWHVLRKVWHISVITFWYF